MDKVKELTPNWEFVADGVMGGVSQGALHRAPSGVVRLRGEVSLENNGGFLQMAFDLAEGGVFNSEGWDGFELEVQGNGEAYDLRLRTDQLTRPWQSFRKGFRAPQDWMTLRFAFADLEPHRTDAVFDPARLRRLGVLAVGRAFEADVAVAAVRLYRGIAS
ncbi:MAG: CIA30 family protein [Pseudomonadota bacterium]